MPANDSKVYVMHAAAGQFVEMNAAVGAMGQGLRFSIVGADGEEEHHLACSCSNQTWGPDGRWLACTSTPPGYEACLVEASTWETHPLDLPLDARLIDWIQP